MYLHAVLDSDRETVASVIQGRSLFEVNIIGGLLHCIILSRLPYIQALFVRCMHYI